MLDDDRLLDDDAGRDLDVDATTDERVVQERERVGRRIGARTEPGLDLGILDRPQIADDHALRLERRDRWSAARPAAAPRPAAGTGRCRTGRSGCSARSPRSTPATRSRRAARPPRSAARRASRARPERAAQRRREDAIRVIGGSACERRRVIRPLPPSSGSSAVGSTRHRAAGRHPTAPSMLSSMRRESSTAYSIGSVLVIGSMKPFTIIAVACCSVRPRLIR